MSKKEKRKRRTVKYKRRKKEYPEGEGPRKLTPIRGGQDPSRNEPCPCGSGNKFKKCCGAPKTTTVYDSPYRTFADMYNEEQKEAERAFVKQWGFNPSPAQLMTFMEGDSDALKAEIIQGLGKLSSDPKFAYAVEKLDMLITPKNQKLVTAEVRAAWDAAIEEGSECHTQHSES